MAEISVVINTLNEERNLPRALSSTEGLANEVVVVDMGSSDRTCEIAKKWKAKIYRHRKTNYVEPARNYAISKASKDWVLILDADEEISKSLADKLKILLKDGKAEYFRIPRKNIIFGKWIRHSRWWPDYNIRFFKKGSVTWTEKIHSPPLTKGKGFDLPQDEKYAIIHHHYESVEQYIERMNRYTTIISEEMVRSGYKFSWRDLIKKPVDEFLSRYFQGEGYKDGLHGLGLSFLQSFSELVIYLKIWQRMGFKTEDLDINRVVQEMKKSESDLHYWQSDVLLKEVGGLSYLIKRRFKL